MRLRNGGAPLPADPRGALARAASPAGAALPLQARVRAELVARLPRRQAAGAPLAPLHRPPLQDLLRHPLLQHAPLLVARQLQAGGRKRLAGSKGWREVATIDEEAAYDELDEEPEIPRLPTCRL